MMMMGMMMRYDDYDGYFLLEPASSKFSQRHGNNNPYMGSEMSPFREDESSVSF